MSLFFESERPTDDRRKRGGNRLVSDRLFSPPCCPLLNIASPFPLSSLANAQIAEGVA